MTEKCGRRGLGIQFLPGLRHLIILFGLFALFLIFAPGARAEGVLAGKTTAGDTQMMAEPSVLSGEIRFLEEGQTVLIRSFRMGWYEILYDGETGYVQAESLIPATEGEGSFGYGLVSDSGARLRRGADEDSKSLLTLQSGAYVKITGVSGGWYKIEYRKKTGYLRADLLRLETRPAAFYSSGTSDEKARQIVETAKIYIGVSYVYGGTSPGRGFDCSGFTQYVFERCGYTLNYRTSQYRNGAKIAYAELRPGDLVFFDTERNRTIGHVGIYIGDGKFIHSPRPGKSVMISSMEQGSYYRRIFVTARRIV